jgi:hypothetical protein
VRQLLYVSNTQRDFPQAELESILVAARRNNAAASVTGMLLYLDGGFLQILEGNDEAVEQIYRRICQDNRHWGASILLDHDTERAFTDWNMGYERLIAGHAETEHVFHATQEAIAGKLSAAGTQALAILLRTFYCVQQGDSRERYAAA